MACRRTAIVVIVVVSCGLSVSRPGLGWDAEYLFTLLLNFVL